MLLDAVANAKSSKGKRKRKFAETRFDCDLPKAYRADQQFILRLFNYLSYSARQLSRITEYPQQYLSINKISHHM